MAKAKTHILIAIDSLVGRGAEKTAINLSEAFIELKCKVSLVIYEDIIEFKINPKINIYKLNPFINQYPKILRRITDNKNVSLFNALLAHIEKKHGDVKLILSNLPRMDRILSRIKDRRIYHVIHNPLSLQNGIQNNTWYKKLVRIKQMKRVYDTRQLITVSKGIEKDLIEVVKIKPLSIQSIYNPFHFDFIKDLANQPTKLLGHNLKKNYMLHIGAFTLKQKRQDLLIKAFANSNLNCKLILLGKGQDEKKIRSLIKYYGLTKKIIIPGFQLNPYPWIKHAKLLLLSSDYEGFGNVLVEALILGTPVLSTNCPTGPGEILSGSMRNSLVNCGDEFAFAKKMYHFSKKPPQINLNSLKRFNAATVAKKYLNLI
jgi:glycosyltransferase involved in cell wall biosynthesis